jgi:hypothetical protein
MKIINNEKGQALFEMILFLPFLIFLYTIFYTVGNSISGSINQQKAVRGYFYQLVKGNSYIVAVPDLEKNGLNGLHTVGFFALGWQDKMPGEVPQSNCFHFSSMLKNGSDEKCESPIRDPVETSRFVRIFTMYGVCGPIFTTPAIQPRNGKTFIIDQSSQIGPSPSPCVLQ